MATYVFAQFSFLRIRLYALNGPKAWQWKLTGLTPIGQGAVEQDNFGQYNIYVV